MPITYKTVIRNAIDGFNNIQNTLANNFSTNGDMGLKTDDNITSLVVSSGTVTNVYTPTRLLQAISKLACIRGGGSNDYITGRIGIYSPDNGVVAGSGGGSSGSTGLVTLHYEDGTVETITAIIS